MATSDYRLRHLEQKAGTSEERVYVLLEFRNSLSGIENLGFQMTSLAGTIAAGSIPSNRLVDLSKHPDVVIIEASRPLKDEMDVSCVAINLIDPASDLRTIPTLGKGAIIGIIDSGFDLTHPCFLDDKKRTRILAAWDQVNLDGVSGPSPQEFKYGVEYTQEAIDWDSANNRTVIVGNRKGKGPHGTWVAGIAAGNGTPHGVFKGVAPEANLILVTYRNDVALGGSTFVLDAIKYIQQRARAFGKPVVINISQGDSLGAHDGTSLIERAIDCIISEGRVMVVASAGNERRGVACHHASGQIEPGRDFVLSFLFKLDWASVDGDTIELWYRGRDRFAIALKTPGGWTSSFVPPGTSVPIGFPAGNTAHVYSEINHPTNGDNHIGIIFDGSDAWEAGTWELILRGIGTQCGIFDAWADRPNTVTVISFESHQSDSTTVTLPGNAHTVITVGGFITRAEREYTTDQVKGDIAPGSSIGPTRDGRLKPDLTAPSTLIMAPRMHTATSSLCYDLTAGTSMAAPHVSGVIALIWSRWPGLKADQIHSALCSTANADSFTGPTPNATWGMGKLDALKAYKTLSTLVEKGETPVENRTVFEFEMDPEKKPDGREAGMAVRIEVMNGNRLLVSGRSNGEKYEGSLTLRATSVAPPEGGDECWRNGVWYANCGP